MICRLTFSTLILLLSGWSAFASGKDDAWPTTRIVPAGPVVMGADSQDVAAGSDEFPARRVDIKSDIAFGTTPVTRGQFAAFLRATDHEIAGGCWTLTPDGWAIDDAANWRAPGFPQTDQHPVTCVSRDDTMAYLTWLTTATGQVYRLPTEAEWVHAAGPSALNRPSETLCAHGNVNDLTAKNKVAKVAEHCDDGFLHTSPVANFSANEFGLFDMVGNVWEWVADCHNGGYADLPTDGTSQTDETCEAYALRGHSWTDPPGPVRLGTRYALPPDARQSIVGFRVVRDLPDD